MPLLLLLLLLLIVVAVVTFFPFLSSPSSSSLLKLVSMSLLLLLLFVVVIAHVLVIRSALWFCSWVFNLPNKFISEKTVKAGDAITGAIKEWMDKSCVEFVPRTNERAYLHIVNNDKEM